MTEVGEEGSRLSGGQRMRVALARATYCALVNPSETVLVLLDDPFSCLDVHVANKIYNDCICGLLSNTTRILVTHHVRFLESCTAVLNLKNGLCRAYGSPQDLIAKLPTVKEKKQVLLRSNADLPTSGNLEFEDEEIKQKGMISSTTLRFFTTSVGVVLSAVTVLSVALMQISRTSIDAWLAYFVSTSDHSVLTAHSPTLLGAFIGNFFAVYIGLAMVNSGLTLIRAFVFAYAGLKGLLTEC